MKLFTTEDDIRWRGLASVVAFIIFVTFAALLIGASIGAVSLGAISQPWFFLFSVTLLTVLAWTFGADMLQAARKSTKE